jgi:hypothetical protein
VNRLTKSVLGVGATMALSIGGGLSTASADEPAPQYPVVHPSETYDTTDTIPAGFSCKAEVTLHETGSFQATEVSETKTRLVFDDSSSATFTAVTYPRGIKRTTSVTVGEGGDGVEQDLGNGVIKVSAEGENIFLGAGIKGVRYGKGDAKFVITNAGEPDQRLTFTKKPHKFVELCDLLGTKPVKGKNVVPPSTDAKKAAATAKSPVIRAYGMKSGR